MTAALGLTRAQVLAHRRRVGALDERLPPGAVSVRRAAWAGLTDSVPRAAVLSLHARVAGTTPSAWQAPGLAQVWGPRFSAYVVPEEDRAVFTLGRLPERGARRVLAEDLAARLEAALDGREIPYGEAGRAVGVHHNQLRYAAATGRVVIRWDGARQPTVRAVPAPRSDPADARQELVRRYLHVMGPGTADSFARWAGVHTRAADATFHALSDDLVRVRTDVGDGWVLARDEESLRAGGDGTAAPARLLPSGDTLFLLWGRWRELLVPDASQREQLWTSRMWPGAVLVDGDVVGTWRRAEEKVTVRTWHGMGPAGREAVEAEARSMPLPGLRAPVTVRWEEEP